MISTTIESAMSALRQPLQRMLELYQHLDERVRVPGDDFRSEGVP